MKFNGDVDLAGCGLLQHFMVAFGSFKGIRSAAIRTPADMIRRV